MSVLLVPGDAPVWTIALPLPLVEQWIVDLGQADVIDWCRDNSVWLHELFSERVYVHGWDDGRRMVQIAILRLPGGTDRGGSRALPYARSLPEGVGHLIRWDVEQQPAVGGRRHGVRHLHAVDPRSQP